MKTLKKIGYVSIEVILVCGVLIIGGLGILTKFLTYTDEGSTNALNYTNGVVDKFVDDDEAWRDGEY